MQSFSKLSLCPNFSHARPPDRRKTSITPHTRTESDHKTGLGYSWWVSDNCSHNVQGLSHLWWLFSLSPLIRFLIARDFLMWFTAACGAGPTSRTTTSWKLLTPASMPSLSSGMMSVLIPTTIFESRHQVSHLTGWAWPSYFLSNGKLLTVGWSHACSVMVLAAVFLDL